MRFETRAVETNNTGVWTEYGMKLELTDEVVVVVGGARGLGQAIASAFAAEGAEVVLLDVSLETLAIAEKLVAKGYLVDATDIATLSSTASSIQAQFHRVDHVVYAAGIGSGQFGFPFWKVDPASWARVLQRQLDRRRQRSTCVRPGHGGIPPRHDFCSLPRSPDKSARRPTRLTAPRRPD